MDYVPQRTENFEFANQKLKSELEDLRTKSKTFENNRHVRQTKIDHYRRQIEDSEERCREFSSADIPTLLHSISITNTDAFPVPLNCESVLRLCILLVECCRVLQQISLRNDDVLTTDNEAVLFTAQIDGDERCRVSIQRRCHSALDVLFERLHLWTND